MDDYWLKSLSRPQGEEGMFNSPEDQMSSANLELTIQYTRYEVLRSAKGISIALSMYLVTSRNVLEHLPSQSRATGLSLGR